MSAPTLYPCGQVRPDPMVAPARSPLYTLHVCRCGDAACVRAGGELFDDLSAWRKAGATITLSAAPPATTLPREGVE